MQHIAKVLQLVQLEWLIDKKRPTVLAAAILQLAIVGLLTMLSQPRILESVWNSIFWISLILSTVQGVSKNFTMVSSGRWIFWSQIASNSQLLWSKIIYGWANMLLLTAINLFIFNWFMGFPIKHFNAYLGIILLVTGGISAIFTFVGAVATKAGNAGYLAPVLSLPIILPILLVGIKASTKTLNPVLVSSVYTDMLLLGALDILILVLTGVLFESLWKE